MKSPKEHPSTESLGLDPVRYVAALRYLFDRPVPQAQEQEWFWDLDEPTLELSPLEWTRVQTMLFANAARDLAAFDNEQVGMGLNYLVSNAVSDVPFAAIDSSVPLDEAMRMMRAMPALWRHCIGPRLAGLQAPIGGPGGGRLGYVCYMWFDIWPTFWNVRHLLAWRDAVWQVLKEMLDVPCREVQVAALHGIGHRGHDLDRRDVIDRTVAAFVRTVDQGDQALRNYAEAARQGMVQ